MLRGSEGLDRAYLESASADNPLIPGRHMLSCTRHSLAHALASVRQHIGDEYRTFRSGMATHHRTKCDQAHKCLRRQHRDGCTQSTSKSLKIIFQQAGIHNEEKDRRNRRRSRQCILNGRVLREELCRQICVGDVFVMRRESIPLQTEGTDPELSTNINLTNW